MIVIFEKRKTKLYFYHYVNSWDSLRFIDWLFILSDSVVNDNWIQEKYVQFNHIFFRYICISWMVELIKSGWLQSPLWMNSKATENEVPVWNMDNSRVINGVEACIKKFLSASAFFMQMGIHPSFYDKILNVIQTF